MTIAKRITKRREEMGFNQAELARRTGYDRAIISRYESGKRTPNNEAILMLSKVLEVDPTYLLAGDGWKNEYVLSETERKWVELLRILPEKEVEKVLDYANYIKDRLKSQEKKQWK